MNPARSTLLLLALWPLLLITDISEAQSDSQDGASRPNILFAIADDASWPHMSAYGTSWVETPAFDRAAEGGVIFTRAYTPNPKRAPSRCIFLPGRTSWQLTDSGKHWRYFP